MEAALKDPFNFPLMGSTPLYVSQFINPEFEALLVDLLANLNRFQVRSFQKAPQKAKSTRRLVYGMREVTRYLSRRKIKFVIVATDLDLQFIESGNWVSVKEGCSSQDVQIVYGLNRSQLGKVITGNPRVDISLVGVLSTDGSNDTANIVRERAAELAVEWENLFLELQTKSMMPLSCIASYYGHEQLYKRLIESGKSDGFITSSGDTDAHLAAARGFLAILSHLSDEQLASKNYSMKTPLDLAKEFNRQNVIAYLEERSSKQEYD